MLTKRASIEETGTCPHCEEAVLEGEEIVRIPHAGKEPTIRSWHHECFFRSVIGSVAHLKKTMCNEHSCDATCRDDPSITKREAARQARAFWEARRNRVN